MKRFARVVQAIAQTWNWKAAVLSSAGRALLFFATNLPAGLDAAIWAGQTEFLYRACASGFYGGLTARFARMRSTTSATVVAMLVVPGVAHLVEYLVHRSAGTAFAATSVSVSIAVSLLTTRVNLFAMRRGLLLVTQNGPTSLLTDLRQLASLSWSWLAGWRRQTST